MRVGTFFKHFPMRMAHVVSKLVACGKLTRLENRDRHFTARFSVSHPPIYSEIQSRRGGETLDGKHSTFHLVTWT
jgi:hypothetical protein